MTIGQGEYKSQVGLDKVYYALVSKDDATGYTAAAPVWLAPAGTAKVSTTRNQNMQYADDGVFDTSEGEGESKIDIEVTNVPLSVAAVLLGRTYNATNGMLIDGSAANPPDCALLFRSKKNRTVNTNTCAISRANSRWRMKTTPRWKGSPAPRWSS